MRKIDYSIVVPVYKSVASLEPLYAGILALMAELGKSFEVIFVEDSGSEDTWKKLLEIKEKNKEEVVLVRLTKNFGQNAATVCGIDLSKGEFVITIDDDMQVHPIELKKLIDHLQLHNYDVVYGVSDESKSYLRTMGSKFVKRLFMRAEHGSNVGSAVRLIQPHIVKYLRNHSQDHLFINQVITWYTFNTGFIKVRKTDRMEGKTGYNLWQLFALGIRLIFLYSSIPLRIIIGLSVISAILSLSLAAYYLLMNFRLGNGQGFMVYVVLSLALILVSLSVMGVYLSRIYASRVRKPQYAIQVQL